MSLRDILRWPDPRLKQTCAPVDKVDTDLRMLVTDMLETMYAAPGRGLAAPQVGEMRRVFVMDAHWKEGEQAPMVFVNPMIVAVSAAQETRAEGCLSIPGICPDVTRPARVRVRWLDLEGRSQEQDFTGFEAACVQHEMDHLDGTVTLDHLTQATRARVLQAYGEALA